MEAVSEEGEVVPAVTVAMTAPIQEEPTDTLLGPLAQWIHKGMPVSEPLEKLGLEGYIRDQAESGKRVVGSADSHRSDISIHTIKLPARAPRSLLLEIKTIFEMFPGPEKIQLKIGDETVPVGLTVTMSHIFEKRIEEVLKKYEAVA